MILNQIRPNVESGGLLTEKFFGVSDLGIIFDILRSKLYSNPILAVCREITCNARDAHREVGKFDVPIEIHLPIGLEPEFKVKDFGPGISPDRMENVFINYASSTKRDSNIQVGSFGIGAKSPFAISDSFSITTIYDGIKYQYACYIDETKVGKLALLSKTNTAEHNGTEIAIRVNQQDFHLFKQYTEQACRHWDVKPIITGNSIQWTELSKVIEGKGWAITAQSSDWQRTAKLVIDGIEYPLELDALRKYADPKLIDSARGHFVMYFDTGELSLSANREQIYLDKPTQDKIRQRLDDIQKEIKKLVDDKIDSFPNLWDANLYYRKELNFAFHNLAFLGKLNWKGHELHNGYVEVECPIYVFQRGKYSSKYGTDPNKLTRSMGRSLQFFENCALYINDLPIKEPTPKQVKKAFDDDAALKYVQVICPNDKQSEADLEKDIDLKALGPKRLSDIAKATGRKYTPASQRLLIFKFDTSGFRQVSYEFMEVDTNDKVLCFLDRNPNYPNDGRWAILSKNSQKLEKQSLVSLSGRYPKTSFYGIDKSTVKTRVDKEFIDFKRLDNFVDEEVLDNKTINYTEIRFAINHRYDIEHGWMECMPKLEPLIADKKSLFIAKLKLHQKIDKLANSDVGLLDIYEAIKGRVPESQITAFTKANPDWNIASVNKAYHKKYPLLSAVSQYGLDPLLDHIAQYVNMVDKI